jgi:D-tyrosyl-tRNA(Tyr) deacylase
VTQASVTVEHRIVGEIQRGLLVFVGVEPSDTDQSVLRMAKRLLSYRIFPDEAGKMNLSVQQVGGAILLVSQFTLAADTRSGNRPSFSTAAAPEQAARLCEDLAKVLAMDNLHIETGQFGADMQVALVNDGPVTFLLSAE